MSEEDQDPIRLRDDPAESAELRAIFEAAGGEHADDAMLEKVLGAVLAGGGGGGGGSGGAPAVVKGISGAMAGAGAMVALVAAVLGVGVWRRGGAEERERESAVVSDAGSDGGGVSDGGSDGGGEGEGEGEGESEGEGEGEGALLPRIPRRPHIEVPPPADPRADLALVRRATAALESDPALALALADEHRSRFPQSPLAEERETDAVLALAALHREAEARTRASALRARWPRSPHLRRIDAALSAPTIE